ncbi:MAG: hypothetical protein R2848_19155 [Thermomicrobiales bacterium]
MNASRTTARRIAASIVAIALVASTFFILPTSEAAAEGRLAGMPSTETLASVSMAEDGSRLVLLKIALAPRVTIRAHSHSGPAVITVISGSLQIDLLRGAATANQDGAETSVEVGATTYLSDGDSIAFAPSAGETLSNHGNEPLLLVASIVLEPKELIFDYDYWTPLSRPNLQ